MRRLLLAGVVLLGACSGSRAASEPTPSAAPSAEPQLARPSEPPTAPATTTTTSRATRPSRTTAPPTRPPRSTTTTTTLPPLTGIDWNVFDVVLSDRIVGGGSRAASVAVAVDGEIVHRRAYGERVPGEPLEASDRFRIASISKMLAAAALLRAVDRGDIGLDEPVLQLVADELRVPIVDPRGRRVTLRQLLGHTSGMDDYENELFYAGSTSCPHAASIAFSQPLEADPGKSYRYSNMNYCILGVLLEALNDEPFERVITREVLRPLDIANMRTAGTRDVGDSDVLHDVAPDRTFMETLGAAGTWIARPSDIVRFADSLDLAKPGRHPVPAKLVRVMRKPSTPKLPGQARRDVWYGLGLMNWRDGSYGHTGTLENTHAMVLVRPDGVTWCVLVSGENPWTSSDLGAMVDEALLAASR